MADETLSWPCSYLALFIFDGYNGLAQCPAPVALRKSCFYLCQDLLAITGLPDVLLLSPGSQDLCRDGGRGGGDEESGSRLLDAPLGWVSLTVRFLLVRLCALMSFRPLCATHTFARLRNVIF